MPRAPSVAGSKAREPTAASASTRRLDTFELLVKNLADNFDEMKQSMRQLRDRDNDLEGSLRKLTDGVADTVREFKAALEKVDEARRADQKAFTTALESQAAAAIVQLQKNFAEKVGSWLFTTAAGAGVLILSYLGIQYGAHK